MAAAQDKQAWDFSFPGIDGGVLDLAAFRGRVLVVANTASFCGYTYQYEGLEKLHQTQAGSGVTVLGVPSRDFNQESPDNGTVKTFCETNFGVDFPLAGIAHVRGAQAAPFYAWVREQTGWEPGWNFNKVLIGRDGRVAGTFGSGDEPQGEKLSRAIAAALQG
ncbi:MAG TPA: glutathione peroxidase [Acetobacteraceae bacterium]|jgi:glutathione peroxidase|nr:glutathione peroxidase [Acetobacteraceae bacterium]